nr:retron St85 family effector protein [Phyllobacterium myrsinacearum]
MVDPDNIRVYQPTSLVLVCGGAMNSGATPPPSLREAFLRLIYEGPFKGKYRPLIAEEVINLFDDGGYSDFLTLETDIAQICSLIIVFSESFGSAAELGAFATSKEIAKRTLVVIGDHEYNQKSFIKYGPIRSLEKSYGANSICVIKPKDIGVENLKNLNNINMNDLSDILFELVQTKAKLVEKHSRFDKYLSGHKIKLIVGLIQWFGALTLEEIEVALYCIGVTCTEDDIENYLKCANFAGWIKSEKRGVRTFHAAAAEIMAVRFYPRPGTTKIDALRWQTEARAVWREKDVRRFNFIAEVQKEAR